MAEDGLLGSLFKCCCGASSLGEELYKDWESHPACQQYTIVKHLGQGGFSEVHLAQDKLSGKTVALKVVFLNKGGLTKEQRKILAGEARLVRMVAHPNIVRCLQVLETRRQQVLVLEYLSGGEMLRQLQRLKRYSEANACQMFKQIVDAVAYLHSLGILHRDIKPENCLLAKPPAHAASKNKPIKVKLIDLGMAGLYRPDRPMKGCMGSPGFIAPEVILGEHHTPAMDIYSLGVLLFIMLVGRKPWDAQRSHTLAYAVQPTCEAPGLRDPIYTGLSPPAEQLLLWMLDEDPSRRPSAQQVLGHTWVLQGGVCKGAGSSVEAGGAAGPSHVYQQVVQQRLQVLSRSRDIMGTARGMMVLHGRGSRSQAVLFHKAVKAARLQLQQQAAALQASGQLGTAEGGGGGINGSSGSPEQQQQLVQQQVGGATSAAAAPAGSRAAGNVQQVGGSSAAGSSVAGSAANGVSAATATGSAQPAANSSSSSAPPEAELARSSAPAASAVRLQTGNSSSSSRGLVRPASTSALAAGAATAAAAAAGSRGSNDAAAGEPPGHRRQKSVTVGQLAREDMLSRHSLLFGALQQQQQGQGGSARGGSTPGNLPSAGRHRHAASEGSNRLGTGTGQGAAAGVSASAAAAAAAGGGGGYAQPISIDLRQLALVDALERGMSAPNTDIPLFSPPAAGSRALQHPRRIERAVSMSPGALALLDAEDQMCLLQAAASVEESDSTALLAGGVLSWGRRGAADMMASFKEHYAVKPFARSIKRFGDSLSRSLGRSGRSPLAQVYSTSPPAASYMQAAAAAAAAAAATEAHMQPQSHLSSDTATPAAAAAAQVTEAAGMPSFTQQGPASGRYAPAATADTDDISFMLAASRRPTEDEQPMVSSSMTAGAAAAAVAAAAAAAAAQLPGPSTNRLTSPHVGLIRLSEDSTGEQHGSLENHGAFLGAQMSLDGSLGLSTPGTLGTSLDARSPHSNSNLQDSRSAGWMPLRAATPTDMARISVGRGSNSSSSVGPGHEGTEPGPAAAGAGNAGVVLGGIKLGTNRASAFASTGGAVAAAVVLNSATSSSSAAGAQHSSRNDPVGVVGVVQSPGVRAAATAAAARAEEEGLGLPNGLWLQQSQSLKSGTIANILSLLSPAKLHSASAGHSGSLDLGGQDLGSAGGSVELASAGCILSETSSGPVSPTAAAGALTSPGQLDKQDADCTEAADTPAADTNRIGACAEAGTAHAGSSRSPSPVSHSRNISMMSWLPDVNTPLEVLPVPDPEATNSTALDGTGPLTPAAVAAAAADGPAAAAAGGAGIATASVDIAGGGSVLLHAPSGAGSSVDQEFYVGSFWSPAGLSSGGAHAARRQQQLGGVSGRARGYLAHSTSSLGRLDSLQESLQGQDSLNAGTSGLPLDLEDVSSALLLSLQAPAAAEVTSDGGDGGAGVGDVDGDGDYVSTGSHSRRSSSSAGVPAGAGGRGGGRGAIDGGEGMLEGCLPGDGSGNTWGRTGRLPHRGAGASVLVRVHSGGVRDGETQPGKAAAAASSVAAADAVMQRHNGVVRQTLPNASSAAHVAGTAAGAHHVQAAAAAEPGVTQQSPSKYGWIAKTVVSRAASPQQAPAQQPPQFDAFDEPHGEWYYTGAT